MDSKAKAFAGLQVPTVSGIRAASAGQLTIIGMGILLTMLPVTMIVPVLKELVSVRFQVSLFWAHMFMSTSLVGAMLFAPLAGIIIDRTGSRRKVTVFALLGNALCFAAMALAPSFPLLMLFRFFEGSMHITALSAWMAAGADTAQKGRSGRIMGALGGMLMLGITIGVPLGGFIAGDDSIRVLWTAALISALTAMLAIALLNREVHSEVHSGIAEFLDTLKEHPWLAIPYGYTFIDRLCIGVVVSTFTLYMADVLLLPPRLRGMELSCFLLPFTILSYPVGRLSDRLGRLWLMAGSSFFFGMVFMTYGFVSDTWLTAAMIASGVLSAGMFAPSLALCKDLSKPALYGTTFSGYNVAGSLGFVIGPLLGGSLFSWFSEGLPVQEAYRWTFVTAGSLELLCAVISLPFLMRLFRSAKVR